MLNKIISQGAEAKLILINEEIIKKIREEKTYRNKILDKKIRSFRNKREFKILSKLYENKIKVPKPLSISSSKKTNENEIFLTMEYLIGEQLKNCITKELLLLAFEEIIKIHNLDITHGDLTTLNILYSNKQIYIIDFGLALFSNNIEEKAVDLNLFFLCIKNEHRELYIYKEELENIYMKKAQKGVEIIERLKKVENRGRNKNKN